MSSALFICKRKNAYDSNIGFCLLSPQLAPSPVTFMCESGRHGYGLARRARHRLSFGLMLMPTSLT